MAESAPADPGINEGSPASTQETTTSLLNQAAPGETATPDTGTTAAQEQTTEVDAKAAEVPESYEFKAPDGMTLDSAAVEAFTPIAKELGLTNEQAQKVVDLYSGRLQAQQEAFTKMQADWVTTVKADKEVGGEQLKASLSAAQVAITKFGTPELRTALETSGLGNHPELVRVFARIGKAMGEDSFHTGASSTAPKTRDAAEILYGGHA